MSTTLDFNNSDTPNQVAAKLGAADDAGELANARTALSVESSTQLNARDTANRNRANHTGTQAISTVTGLQTALDGKATAAQGTLADTAVQSVAGSGLARFRVPAGDNIFNIADAENAVDFYVNNVGGAISSNAAYIATHYMPVNAGRYYYCSAYHKIAFYDAGKVFISGVGTGDGILPKAGTLAPSGAAYMRLSIRAELGQTRLTELMVTPTADSTGSYPFKSWTGAEAIDSSQIPNFDDQQTLIAANQVGIARLDRLTEEVLLPTVNLFDKNSPDLVPNTYINHLNGAVAANATYSSSAPIPVVAGLDYYVSNIHRYAWYDVNMVFISGAVGDNPSFAQYFTAPAGAAYLRFSVYNTQINIIMAAQSTTAVPFEAYGTKIVDANRETLNSQVIKMIANIGNTSTWVTPTNVLYIGDSFWNDATDIAAETISQSGIAGNYSLSVSGSTLSQIPAVLNGFDRSAYDCVVIGRVTNDIGGGQASFEEARRRLMEIIVLFQDVQLIVTNVPPLNNHVGYSPAMQSAIDETNAWLATLWSANSSRRVFDLNAVLDADADGNIDPAYDRGGTDIHPQNAGYVAAGAALAARLI